MTRTLEYWLQIESWLSANAPDVLPFLPSGVSDADVAKAERMLGYKLPRELADFLAVHDGSGNIWLHDCGVFMSLEVIVKSWDSELDLWGDGDNDEWAMPKGPIKKKWFNRKWLPVLDTWCGNYTCMDLDPAKGGKHGQLFSWLHDNGPTQVVAPSFGALLRQFVEELEAGLYTRKLNQQGQPYLECSVVARMSGRKES